MLKNNLVSKRYKLQGTRGTRPCLVTQIIRHKYKFKAPLSILLFCSVHHWLLNSTTDHEHRGCSELQVPSGWILKRKSRRHIGMNFRELSCTDTGCKMYKKYCLRSRDSWGRGLGPQALQDLRFPQPLVVSSSKHGHPFPAMPSEKHHDGRRCSPSSEPKEEAMRASQGELSIYHSGTFTLSGPSPGLPCVNGRTLRSARLRCSRLHGMWGLPM